MLVELAKQGLLRKLDCAEAEGFAKSIIATGGREYLYPFLNALEGRQLSDKALGWLLLLKVDLQGPLKALSAIDSLVPDEEKGPTVLFNKALLLHHHGANEVDVLGLLDRASHLAPSDMDVRLLRIQLLSTASSQQHKLKAATLIDELTSTEVAEGVTADIAINSALTLGLQVGTLSRRRLIEKFSRNSIDEALLNLITVPPCVETQEEFTETGSMISDALTALRNVDDLDPYQRRLVTNVTNFYIPYYIEEERASHEKYYDFLQRCGVVRNLQETKRLDTPTLVIVSNFRFHPAAFVRSALSDFSIKKRGWKVIQCVLDQGPPLSDWRLDPEIERVCLPATGEALEALPEALARMRPGAIFYPEVGMTRASRYLSTLRIAPIQFTSWLHPSTSGSRNLDYFLSSELMEPNGCEDAYTERLVRSRGLGLHFEQTIVKTQLTTQNRTARGQPRRVACIQSFFKLPPFVDELFDRCLDDQPDVCMALLAPQTSAEQSVLQRRLLRWKNRERVIVQPRMDRAQWTNFLSGLDFSIDSPWWSGGNTTIDCLAVNVPVIAFEGTVMRQRHTAAMLRMIGCEELIASNKSDYVSIFRRLVADADFLHQVREKIKKNKMVLFSSDAGAADLDFLEQ